MFTVRCFLHTKKTEDTVWLGGRYFFTFQTSSKYLIMDFNLNEAIKIANQLTFNKFHRNLTDVEIMILKGAWNKEEYDSIAAKHQYSTGYISQDAAFKLWKMLTESLGEKVRKSNFREALKRHWNQQFSSQQMKEHQDNISLFKSDIDQHLEKNAAKNQHRSDLKQETLSPEIYVERPPIESICCETIKQPGSLIRIKAPSFMGKTYLIDKVLFGLARQNYRTVNLSFELADSSTHFTNLNKFLRWFCTNLSRGLGLTSKLDEYWDEEGMGAKVSCTTYFEEYLLQTADTPLVLCLDDVDLLFPYPQIYEDFFGLLRSWYEKARSRRIWKKLRLIIAHSTDVYIRLNINQSPFNIGLPIELSEFTKEQVKNFAEQHGVLVDEDMLEQLMKLVGGHPYLLELAFAHLKNYPSTTLKQLVSEATTEAGIYGHHLREHWLNLQQHPELAQAFAKVISSLNSVRLEPMLAYQLYSMGLVKLFGNMVSPRCNLYRQFFGIHLQICN